MNSKLFVEAVQKVSDIATHINNHIKQHENFQKMLSIQKCFDKSAPKLLTPGREFIKEGILKKVKFCHLKYSFHIAEFLKKNQHLDFCFHLSPLQCQHKNKMS